MWTFKNLTKYWILNDLNGIVVKEMNKLEKLVEKFLTLPNLPENVKRLVDELDANNEQIRTLEQLCQINSSNKKGKNKNSKIWYGFYNNESLFRYILGLLYV